MPGPLTAFLSASAVTAVDEPSLAEVLHAVKHVSPEEVLLPVLLQLILIVLAARLFAGLFRHFGQPSVVGEIMAGLILGPSVLKPLAPQTWEAIFHPALPGLDPRLGQWFLNGIMTTLAQLGLVLLLFLIGLEFDFSHLRERGKSAVAISLTGVLVPFVLGLGLAPLMLPFLEPHQETGRPIPALGFALFLGTALSITAIPILGRIMMELNITRSRLGAITISAAAVDDAVGWTMLAAVAAAARGQFEALSSLVMLGETVGFALLLYYVVRPVVVRWSRRALAKNGGEIGLTDLAVLLALLFSSAIVTNLIGIFAIFGAFLLGAVLSGEAELREAIARRVRDFVTAFFLPIFFTFTGLRTQVDTLDSPLLWGFCGLVLLAAVFGKLVGCGVAARLTGFSARESACIGTMMNTRALMELIVINVGYELGVIPRSAFCMLVFMAVTTTIMTTPLLLRLMRGTEIEPLIRQSSMAPPNPDRRGLPVPT